MISGGGGGRGCERHTRVPLSPSADILGLGAFLVVAQGMSCKGGGEILWEFFHASFPEGLPWHMYHCCTGHVSTSGELLFADLHSVLR